MINISTVNDIRELTDIKEQIKNQIKEEMTWQQRIELYKKIQLINERIKELDSVTVN